MATFVGLHNRIYVGHLDLSGLANEVEFGPLSRAMQDVTTFNDGGYRAVKPGTISGAAAVRGFQDFAADVLDDEISLGQIGTQYPVTVIPNPTGTVAVGDAAWFSRGLVGELDPLGGERGAPGTFDLAVPYDAAIVQAKVLAPAATVSADTNGTALALAGPTASQRLYAAVHVLGYTGFTSVVFKVQSDDSSGFSSPTDRITFTTVTGKTSEFASVAGSFVSETHHRLLVDVTGTGTVTYVAVIGVV